jgi:hypothetical protein
MKSLWTRILLVLVSIPVIGSFFTEYARATTTHTQPPLPAQVAPAHEEHEAIYFVGCGGFL